MGAISLKLPEDLLRSSSLQLSGPDGRRRRGDVAAECVKGDGTLLAHHTIAYFRPEGGRNDRVPQ